MDNYSHLSNFRTVENGGQVENFQNIDLIFVTIIKGGVHNSQKLTKKGDEMREFNKILPLKEGRSIKYPLHDSVSVVKF